jgi:hypothetical protein
MENRIKECQIDLFADRTSTRTMAANQLRLWFASMAYVLVERHASSGLAGDRSCRCLLRNDPSQAVQDRRPHHYQRPPDQVRHGVRLSLQGRLCHRASRTAPCRRHHLILSRFAAPSITSATPDSARPPLHAARATRTSGLGWRDNLQSKPPRQSKICLRQPAGASNRGP